jgi:HEAT repeat protein
MAPRATLEEKLAGIAEMERQPFSPEIARELQARLADASNIVVARAAEAIGLHGGDDLIPILVNTFQTLIRQPAAADKNCYAKEAIIAALERLDSPDPDPYLLGIRHVQMEPVFGGRVDTAANLRGHCATALARMRYREAHYAITPLLVDPEPQTRRAGIKALAHLGDERSELLLRLKALMGDTEPGVLGECLSGLLELEPDHSLPFAADFLRSADAAIVEQAALALGGSHLDDAFTLLHQFWERNSDFALRKTLLLSIALIRSEEAFNYLLHVMQDEGGTVAVLACEALAIYGSDSKRRDQVAEVVERLRDARVTEAFREAFEKG